MRRPYGRFANEFAPTGFALFRKIRAIKISVTTPPYSLLIPGELGADSVIYQGRSLRQGVALFFSGGNHLFLRYMSSSY
jgi:hypothetical protein